MSKLKVAVAIDSKGDITQTHFGDCKTIVFAEISEEGYTVLERTRNLLRQDNDGDHGDLRKLKTARDLLHEVCILVAGRMSPNFKKLRLQDGKMPVISTQSMAQTLEYLTANLSRVVAHFENPDNIYLKIG